MILLVLLTCFIPALNAMKYTKTEQRHIACMPQIMQDIFQHPNEAKKELKNLLQCIQRPAYLYDLQWLLALEKLTTKEWNKKFDQNKKKYPLRTWEETIPSTDVKTAIYHQVYPIFKRQRKYPLSPATMRSLAADVYNTLFQASESNKDEKPTTPPFNAANEIERLVKVVDQLSSDSFSQHFRNRLTTCFKNNSKRSMCLVRTCQNTAAMIDTLQKHNSDEMNCMFHDTANRFSELTDNIEIIIYCAVNLLFTFKQDYKNQNPQIVAQSVAIVESFKDHLIQEKKN